MTILNFADKVNTESDDALWFTVLSMEIEQFYELQTKCKIVSRMLQTIESVRF